jgi:hypothetical protein
LVNVPYIQKQSRSCYVALIDQFAKFRLPAMMVPTRSSDCGVRTDHPSGGPAPANSLSVARRRNRGRGGTASESCANCRPASGCNAESGSPSARRIAADKSLTPSADWKVRVSNHSILPVDSMDVPRLACSTLVTAGCTFAAEGDFRRVLNRFQADRVCGDRGALNHLSC